MNIATIINEAKASNQAERLCKHAMKNGWFKSYKIDEYKIDRQYRTAKDIAGVFRRYRDSEPAAVVVQWSSTAKILRHWNKNLELHNITPSEYVETITLSGLVSEEKFENVINGMPKWLYFIFLENP